MTIEVGCRYRFFSVASGIRAWLRSWPFGRRADPDNSSVVTELEAYCTVSLPSQIDRPSQSSCQHGANRVIWRNNSGMKNRYLSLRDRPRGFMLMNRGINLYFVTLDQSNHAHRFSCPLHARNCPATSLSVSDSMSRVYCHPRVRACAFRVWQRERSS